MSLLAILFGQSQPVSDPGHWLLRSVGAQTHAGVAINEHTAFELPVVYRAINIIADGVAQLPIDVGRKVGDRRDPIEDHGLQRVMNLRGNPFMAAMTVRKCMLTHALGWGNGYAEIQRDGSGKVVALWPLLPDRTWPETSGGRVYFVTHIGGEQIVLEHDRVLHVPALGFDGLKGYSPLYLARQALGLGKALEEFGGKFFANDAKSGGFIQHPGKLSPEANKNLRTSAEKQGGLDNAHRLKVLEEGAKFVQTTIAPEDAQFLMTRQFQIEEIGRMYGVPLNLLQSHSKDTSWGTGIGENNLAFLQFTLSPWIVLGEQEMAYKLLSEAEQKRGVYIRHNVSGLLRGDAVKRGAYYTQALNPQSGWMKPNEVRQLEDLNPLEDDGPATADRPPAFPPAADPTSTDEGMLG